MTRGTTEKTKATSYVLPTSTIYSDHIVFDDGSWGTKGRRLDTETGRETFYSQLAVVATNDVDLGGEEYAGVGSDGEDHIVEVPGQVFGTAVGPKGLRQRRATFEMSKVRYTSPAATSRFYACLGTLLGDRREATIHLTVGANDEVIHTMRNNIRLAFLNPDSKGVPQPHVFRVDGRDYTVTVARVRAVSQAWAAAKSIRSNPPESIAAKLERQPLEDSTVVVLDPGGMSTDVSVLHPDTRPGHEGELTLALPMFSVMKGTGEIKARLASYIDKEAGYLPGALDLEARTDPRVKHLYGWIATDNGRLDLLPALAQIKHNIWSEIWADVSSKVNSVKPQYILVVGGGAIVFKENIENTLLNGKGGTTKRLGDFNGFAIPEDPQLAVARGMAALGDEDAAKQV